MPLYEYQCESCGKRFERIQKFSDPPVDACPFCGGKVEKLLSSPAIQFKGSGFYITDYARKSESGESTGKSGKSGKSGESGESGKSGESDKSTAASETKPAASTGSSSSTSAPKPAPKADKAS